MVGARVFFHLKSFFGLLPVACCGLSPTPPDRASVVGGTASCNSSLFTVNHFSTLAPQLSSFRSLRGDPILATNPKRHWAPSALLLTAANAVS